METLNIEAELKMFISRACFTYLNAKKNVQQVVDFIVYLSNKSGWMPTVLFSGFSKGSRTVKF